MTNTIREWLRADAEQRIVDVLDDAKRGRLQRIVDREGVFELIFRADNTYLLSQEIEWLAETPRAILVLT